MAGLLQPTINSVKQPDDPGRGSRSPRRRRFRTFSANTFFGASAMAFGLLIGALACGAHLKVEYRAADGREIEIEGRVRPDHGYDSESPLDRHMAAYDRETSRRRKKTKEIAGVALLLFMTGLVMFLAGRRKGAGLAPTSSDSFPVHSKAAAGGRAREEGTEDEKRANIAKPHPPREEPRC